MTETTQRQGGKLRIRPAAKADAPTVAVMIEELNAHQREPTGQVTAEAVQRDGFGPHAEFGVLLAELDEPMRSKAVQGARSNARAFEWVI